MHHSSCNGAICPALVCGTAHTCSVDQKAAVKTFDAPYRNEACYWRHHGCQRRGMSMDGSIIATLEVLPPFLVSMNGLTLS